MINPLNLATDTFIGGTPNALPVILDPEFNTHATTDRSRWQDLYDSQVTVAAQIADLQGKVLDNTNAIAIANDTGFTVDSTLGGIISVITVTMGSTFTKINISGVDVYSSEGIQQGLSLTKTFEVKDGDTVVITNGTSSSFIPYMSNGSSVDISDKANLYHTMSLPGGANVGDTIASPYGWVTFDTSVVQPKPEYAGRYIYFSDNTSIGYNKSTDEYGYYQGVNNFNTPITILCRNGNEYPNGSGWQASKTATITSLNTSGYDIDLIQRILQYVPPAEVTIDVDDTYEDLQSHKATDKNRWQDWYTAQEGINANLAALEGKYLSGTETELQNSTMFYSTDQLGGVVTVVTKNTATTYTEIRVNGAPVYSSEGIMQGLSLTKSIKIDYGNSVQVDNATSATYQAYATIPDFMSSTDVYAALQSHMTTDKSRWQDYYNTQSDLTDRVSTLEGKMLDEANQVTLQNNVSFDITNELGGVIALTATNSDTNNAIIVCNNVEVYNSYGIASGLPISKTYEVVDVPATCIVYGTSTAFYIPYKSDPNSPINQVLDSQSKMASQIAALQKSILDIKASIQNQVPDTANTANVANITYTVSNTLGGQLLGKGSTVLGLLGIKVASSGTVTVNGVNVYDNTSLLGTGPIETLTLDVFDGDVVVSSGMDSLTFTPYIAA